VAHLFLTRRCVRPEHLEAVTSAENQRRKIERRARLMTPLVPQIITGAEFDDDPFEERWPGRTISQRC
jgi:hypothetical protein